MSTHTERVSAIETRAHESALSLSPERAMTALVLAAWAGLFWFLIFSGRTSLYLSNRTDWVVPVGAIALTIATLGRLASVRVLHREPLTRRRALGMGVIVIPVIVVVALPPASLGSYAASRRSSFASGGIVTSAGDIASGELSLVDVAGGLRSREGMRALVDRAGEEVTFTGFVDRKSGQPADEFMLTRFMISCCVADALSIQVRVVGAPPGRLKADEWVRVTGAMYPLGREVIVDSSGVAGVPKPKHPYLNP